MILHALLFSKEKQKSSAPFNLFSVFECHSLSGNLKLINEWYNGCYNNKYLEYTEKRIKKIFLDAYDRIKKELLYF